MSSIKPHVDFARAWGDQEALGKLRNSTKSREVIILNCENILKDMAQRFERSPMQVTLSWWARDLVDAGCNDLILKEAFKSVPFKFEKCPTLAQLMELIRPYLAKERFLESDLDVYTRLVFKHANEKFKKLVGEENISRMITYYRNEAFGDIWTDDQIIKCVVLDWVRTYCSSDPKKIIEQGKISNQKATEKDVDYFLLPLKRYAKENNLSVNDF